MTAGVLPGRLWFGADAFPPLVPVLPPIGDELFGSAIHSSIDARLRTPSRLEGPCQNAHDDRQRTPSPEAHFRRACGCSLRRRIFGAANPSRGRCVTLLRRARSVLQQKPRIGYLFRDGLIRTLRTAHRLPEHASAGAGGAG